MKETENNISVHAELPGMKKEDIQVDVHNGVLTLSGEKKEEKKEEKEHYHRYFSLLPCYLSLSLNILRRIERSYGKFTRSFALPNGVDASQITASFQDGVLELAIPKPQVKEPERKKIDIK